MMNQTYNCSFLQEKLEQGAQLIDVRTPMEYSQGALSDAVNMPVERFQHMMEDIDPKKPVLLYCRTGARSGMVKNYLDQLGFNQVHNIGGINQFIGCMAF